MATLIDTLLVSLKLDDSQFSDGSRRATAENDKLSASIDRVEGSSADLTITIKNLGDETKETKEKTDDFTKSVNGAVKALAGLFTAIFVSTGLTKLINETSQANDKLNFLSKNLGMTAKNVSKWQGAAEMAGGSADGMASSLTNLSKSLWDFVTTGDASILPYFDALKVGVVDSAGKLRNLDDILLDVADSFSKMERPQAYNIAKSMGFDEGTINMLLQGRAAMEAQLAAQERIVISTEKELEVSRKLNESNSLISRQWEGLKTIIGNYLTPYFLAFSQKVSKWMDYLNQNKGKVVLFFKGVAAVIGLMLIPLAIAAGKAFIFMFAPLFTGVGLLALLAGAFKFLYDDYKVWQRGGKSLINWGEWKEEIDLALKAFDELKAGFGAVWGSVESLGESFEKLWEKTKPLVKNFADFLNLDFSNFSADKMFDRMISSITRSIDLVRVLVEAITKLMDQDWNGAWDSLKEAGGMISEGVKNSTGYIIGDMFKQRFLPEYLGGAPGHDAQRITSTASGISAEAPSAMKRVYKTVDGGIIKEDGSRSWRNNNPGNIEYGDYAKRMGAIGTDGRFAIFPDEETGKKAKSYLIFEGNGARQLSTKGDYGSGIGYKDKTLSQAITSYAPPEENPTAVYIRSILAAVGSDKRMGDYSGSEREKILEAMKQVEGWKEGKQYASNSPSNAIQSLQSFGNQISKPLVSGIENGSNQFMAQSQKLNSKPSVVNSKIDVQFRDILVQTSASTVNGVTSDAIQGATERLYQLVPSLG